MAVVEIEWIGEFIAKIILNDPTSRNAMSEEMAREFRSTIRQLEAEERLRVVVLTGAGDAFSGGGHLDMLFEKTKLGREENRRRMMDFYTKFLCLRELPVPTIAAINGHAVGAGLCLALACDVRVASDAAKLGMNFVQLGLHPGMGATYFLPKILGPARSAELLYSGAIVTAPESLALGLVQHVVPNGSVFDKAIEIASRIASAGPHSVRQLRESLQRGESDILRAALEREAECQAENYASAEFMEGISAAKEKRKAQFESKTSAMP